MTWYLIKINTVAETKQMYFFQKISIQNGTYEVSEETPVIYIDRSANHQ